MKNEVYEEKDLCDDSWTLAQLQERVSLFLQENPTVDPNSVLIEAYNAGHAYDQGACISMRIRGSRPLTDEEVRFEISRINAQKEHDIRQAKFMLEHLKKNYPELLV